MADLVEYYTGATEIEVTLISEHRALVKFLKSIKTLKLGGGNTDLKA